MLELLHSNVVLIVGALVALLVVAIRALTKDRFLKGDLRGALFWFALFLATRIGAALTSSVLSEQGHRVVRMVWMSAAAFGVVRTAVSIGLWVVRLRSSVPTPKIVRDVVDFVLYAIALITIVKMQLDVDLSGVLATSAVLSVVLGLALQETLGNLFAGLSLQVERPFQVGDFVNIGEHTGRVLQIAWRATRIETLRREVVTLPNSIVSKTPVKNFSRGSQPVGIDLYTHVGYDTPPNAAREAMLHVISSVPKVLAEPPPRVRVWAYDPDGVRWQVRYFVAEYTQADNIMDEFYSRLWYRLRREGMEIPYPQRTLHFREEQRPSEVPEETVSQLLQSVEAFSVLSEQQRTKLQDDMVPRRFGRGEKVIEEGAPGRTFYMVVSGEVSVRAGKSEVATLQRGQYFGEMSLLTGEPRAATVVATTDAVLLELDRPAFSALFAEHQGLANDVSNVLAQRKNQLQAVVDAGGRGVEVGREANRILGRLKQIFRI